MRRPVLRALAAAVLAAGCVSQAGAQAAGAVPVTAPGADRLLPLEVTVNSMQGGSWTLLERGGMLYAPADAFTEWRVTRRPGAQAVNFHGEPWYSLASVPGFEARMNLANQSVDLVFAPAAFAQTRLATDVAARPALSAVEPALFLNFDTSLTQTAARGAPASRDLGVLGEAGYATRLGVLTSSFAGQNLSSRDPTVQPGWKRLETTFTHDFPDSNLTLRLGDSTTRAGLLDRPSYFGGLQLTRNFGLSPGFVTQPIPVIAGTSSAPSTVELYVNDALRQTSRVPAGPFTIDNFALLTGAGEARLVVRDLLGRETVTVQPFFTNTSLLDTGLSDWSLEAGAPRRDLGLASAAYGPAFASGFWRRGMSAGLTLEARGELSRDVRDASAGATFALPLQSLGMAAAGFSQHARDGRGAQWLAGIERDNLRHGFTLRAQGASRNFRQIGLADGVLPNALEFSGSYSYGTERLGAIGLGMARLKTWDRGTLDTYTLNYSMRLAGGSSLTLSATRVVGDNAGATGGTSVGVALSVPLAAQRSLSANATVRAGRFEGYGGVTQGMAGETGLAWRALAGTRENTPYSEGGVSWQGDKLLLTADASASSAQQALRLGAQGGLVFMDGRFFVSRRVQDSFALVEVPGYPGVGVGFQGAPLTRTDAAGVALLPRLLPYQANSIRLDAGDLPISAELDSIEQVAVPPMRSGVKVVFPVRSGRGALVRIVLDDGQPAPAGAQVERVGDPQEFFVARRGEAFITGLSAANTVRLTWKGRSCGFDVALPPGGVDEIARIGPLTCAGVAR